LRRHGSLRTSFGLVHGSPVQIVEENVSLPFTFIDLTEGLQAEPEAETARIINKESRKPFVLSIGPLFRTIVIKQTDESFVLHMLAHHTVSDGWSGAVLVRELTALYDSFSQGIPSPLPELPIQYTDFAAWQREYLAGEKLQQQLTFWKRKLCSAP